MYVVNVMVEYFQKLISRSELISPILIGLFGIFISKALKWLCSLVRNSIYSFREFTISGAWLATFDSLFVNGEQIIELVRLKQKKENISIYLEHYNSQINKVMKYTGSGIKRGDKFSAFYNAVDKSRDQSGVIALVLKSNPGKTFPIFSGTCIEYGHSAGEDIKEFKNIYELRRIRLSLYRRVRLFLRITCFENYDKINSYVKLVPYS